MNTSTSRAIFVRNLVNYFASPTGYVFICLYVLLSSVAAFCPYEFFNSNLANLDQLNLYFPLIMLIFIPTITMSIWADERRQGTDELLLTIPASDLDIVLGKYLAAVAIFTIALLFSGASNLAVLAWLGDPDLGLLAATHLGYWLIGVTMLAVGMAGSFMTSNITVAFILGAVLNAPLVASYWADALFGPSLAEPMRTWSVGHRFADFGRGVISLSGVAYFVMIAAVMLYLCMVLIGQRHWRAPFSAAFSWGFHLVIHGVLLAVFIFGAWFLFGEKDASNELAKTDAVAAKNDGATKDKKEATEDGAAAESKVDAASEKPAAADESAEKEAVPLADAKTLGLGVATGLILLYLALHVGILWIWHAAMPQGIGATMPGHYLLRTLVLVVVLGGLVTLVQQHDLRADATSERLSSLSPKTRELLADLDVERPVQIEAFISPKVPDSFIMTRMNLVTMLNELDALGGDKVQVTIRDTEKYTEEAARAEQLYGITPQRVASSSRGVWSAEDIFLHVAVKCGVRKVDPLFYNRGIPPEYELVRSIATVSQQERKRIGVVTTDVPLFGQFNFQTGASTSDWRIIDELRKQYDVEQVDLTTPIPEDEHYDMLLAVQPSTLGPDQMDNFVAAIREGMPTAIFEDPMSRLAGGIPGTSEPRQPPQMGSMMGSRQSPPKGNIDQLWETLGVIFDGTQIVWQDYNPYPQFDTFTQEKEFVFVGHGAVDSEDGADDEQEEAADESDKGKKKGNDQSDVFNQDDDISSGLQQLLFPFPGSVRALPSASSEIEFVPLVRTGTASGTIPQNRILWSPSPFVAPSPDPNRFRHATVTGKKYILAAHIRSSDDDADSEDANPADNDAESTAKPKGIHVVLTADLDMLTPAFFHIREQGNDPDAEVQFQFDNVPFILNVVDVLAGDLDFLELRKRRRIHRTLVRIEEETKSAKEKTAEAREKFNEAFNDGMQREQDAFDKKIDDLRNRPNVDFSQMLTEVAMAEEVGQRRLDAEVERLERERDAAIDKIETELNLETLRVQSSYKMRAALYPLVPPLFLGLIVFVYRRTREREGVDPSRLR